MLGRSAERRPSPRRPLRENVNAVEYVDPGAFPSVGENTICDGWRMMAHGLGETEVV
jgi:hypothetical protein